MFWMLVNEVPRVIAGCSCVVARTLIVRVLLRCCYSVLRCPG